jgi:hypothetical protein
MTDKQLENESTLTENTVPHNIDPQKLAEADFKREELSLKVKLAKLKAKGAAEHEIRQVLTMLERKVGERFAKPATKIQPMTTNSSEN